MNRQQLVEAAIAFYKGGGKPGWNYKCCYRGEENNELCAVGCLLQDPESFQQFADEVENYGEDDTSIKGMYNAASEMERADILEQIKDILPEDVEGIEGQLQFLRELQKCHDSYADESLEEFLEGFKATAKEMLAASLAGVEQ